MKLRDARIAVAKLWAIAFFVVLLLSAVAGEMEKQDQQVEMSHD